MIQVVLVALGAVWVGVMAFAMQEWSAPLRPVSVVAALCALIVVIRAAYVSHQRPGAPGRELAPGLIELLGVVVVVGLSGLWAMPSVRAGLARPVASQNQMSAERALRDESAQVREAACVAIFHNQLGASRSLLLDRLYEDPEVGAACLKRAAEAQLSGVPDIAARLAQRWATQLMSFESGPDACDYVTPFVTVSATHTPQQPRPVVLACATSSANGHARVCCAKHIEENGFLATQMGPATSFDLRLGAQVYPILSAMTFRREQLDQANEQIAASLKTEAISTRRWVSELGCHLISASDSDNMAGLQGLVSFMGASTCAPKEAEVRALFNNAQAWEIACEALITAPPEQPAEKALCEGIKRTQVALAVEAAKARSVGAKHIWNMMTMVVAVEMTSLVAGYNNLYGQLERDKLWEQMSKDERGRGFRAMTYGQFMEVMGIKPPTFGDVAIDKMLSRMEGAKSFYESADRYGLTEDLKQELKKVMGIDANQNIGQQADRMGVVLGKVLMGKDIGLHGATPKMYSKNPKLITQSATMINAGLKSHRAAQKK